ncbi:PREDICTED: uncharacterized protein LOC109211675 [Nicotiana attenuata]|uniref:uncharacterized protein LOC109211675 n=1 Tax=Nicotiana attenuata TaxID=49451 RepID=UPI000905699C|nr:PREDICTED: uncharacterized protein LOC109211675 [Nicotiana attenuata]
MNSVNSSLLGGIMYAFNAQSVWDDLYERFYKVDGSRTFNLYKEIATGAQARSQIIMRSPLPTVNQAYSMIISDESQKTIAATSGILGANPAITTGNYDVEMYTRNMGNQRYKKNYNIKCEFCKLKGHSKENCFKIVGYPPDFKFKKKGNIGTGGSAAYNVLAEDLFNGRMKEIGKERDGLYILLSQLANKDMNLSLLVKEVFTAEDINLWHIRFGHVSITVLRKMLQNKAESIAEYFLSFVQIQFNKIVKAIRTDNGTKFINTICSDMFKKLGIIHQRTCVYTPQQNGVADRKHRHILEVTRAIRFQANIPIKFWGHCGLAAIYIINRMLSSVVGVSPYEKLYKRKPSLNHLRILGCQCYAKII